MATDLRFRSVWRIPADPDAVRTALADVAGYPAWWPNVTEAERDASVDTRAETGRIAVRGPLPATLRVRLTAMPSASGVLAARIGGDLLGWCSWHVAPDADGGTCVVFQQHVMVRRRSLRTLASIAPGRLRANHAAVMRAGEAGLTAHLGG